jgi:hypothetical protein
MKRNSGFKSWRRSRAFRLPPEYYASGQAVHIVVRVSSSLPPIPDGLARDLTTLLFADPRVLVACVMPDHVHYLAVVDGTLSDQVGAFKGLSTRQGWKHGYAGRLWQRSFYDQVIWRPSQVEVTARYIVENPVRAGLVDSAAAWPFCFCRLEG